MQFKPPSKPTFEQTLSRTYDATPARNRLEAEARARREAPLKGATIEETLANVYDHIQQRDARAAATPGPVNATPPGDLPKMPLAPPLNQMPGYPFPSSHL